MMGMPSGYQSVNPEALNNINKNMSGGAVAPVISVGSTTPAKSSAWDKIAEFMMGPQTPDASGKKPGMMDSLMGMLSGAPQQKPSDELGKGGTTSLMAGGIQPDAELGSEAEKKAGAQKPGEQKKGDAKKDPDKFTFGLQLMPVQPGSVGDPSLMMHPDLLRPTSSPWAKTV